MRLVSWHLNRATWASRKRFATADEHRHGAWTKLANLGVDVALIQEAAPPPGGLDRPPVATLPAGDDPDAWRSRPWPARWWCSAIASWGPTLDAFDAGEGYAPMTSTMPPWRRCCSRRDRPRGRTGRCPTGTVCIASCVGRA